MSLPDSPAARLNDPRLARQREWIAARLRLDEEERFSRAILASAVLHMIVVFGVGQQWLVPDPRLFQNSAQPLDVVLVNAWTKDAPLKADVLAQHSLDGGGNVDEDRRASTPLPASDHDSPASRVEQDQRPQMQAAENPRERMTQTRSNYAIDAHKPETQAEVRPQPPVPAPADLASASLEMARLQARIDQEWEAYQKRPRKTFVGARAQEYTFARYVDDWRLKVERVGNLNYPEAARRNRIYGALVLTVEIDADGRLVEVSIDRGSGSKILDAAAVRIVEMSAPFAPFPPELRKKTDILAITRTWSFTREDHLVSQ